MQSPVAILQKQRQYRASSYSQGTPFGMATGTTPSSFSSSFIDHAFDHPTPTSFSQLQLLSSSVTSQDGSDYTHRVPKVEEQFCSGFNCCGLELDDLHHLLEHFEECHVLPGGGSTPASASAAAAIAAASGRAGAPSGSNSNINNINNNSSSSNSNSNNNAPSSSSAAAGPSSSSSHSKNASSALASRNGVSLSHDDEDADGDADGEGEGDGPSDMPDFDDFEGDSPSSTGAGGGALQPGGSSSAAGIVVPGSSGHGPTLSAPPSPALSSYSDHHPPNGGGSGTSNLYELKTKRRLGSGAPPSSSNNNSNSSFPIFNTNGAPSKSGGRVSSTSPPSDYEDANSMHSEDEHSGVLPFTRRNRQQSVDSLASVSTNASTSSKKRNFNTALGPSNPNHSSSNINIANIPAGMQGHQPSKPSLTGLDFANIRGRTSGFSTPDSSVPGTPASEHEGIEMPGVGCLPPSLLFPLRHNSRNPYSSAEEDMTTDEEDDDGRSLSYDQDASGTDGEDGDGDDIDDNIRFQHQLLQQQQMLYGQQMQALQQQQNGGMNNGSMGIQPQQMMGGMNMNMTMGNNSNNMNNGQFNFAAMNGMNMAGFAQGNNNQQGQQQQQQQQQWDPSAMNFNMAAYGNQMMNGNMGNMNMNMMNNNNNNNFANMLGTTPTAEPSMKKKKMQQQQQQSGGPSSSSGGGGSSSKPKKNKSGSSNKHSYDASIDSAAAAMFSPLTLQNGQGSNIPMPTISASTSPSSQATASAATLAAIQAAAAANAFPDASTPTGRVWIPNNAKPFKCPVPGCDKAYKQQNGLKYHRLHGHCNQNSTGEPAEEGEDPNDKEEDKPFGCYVGPACGKKYKNMNGLRYHYQHSGAHGQIGLQMLTNGTHPPPAYPPGHKRAGLKNYGAEFSNNPSPTVVMNQSTAEAILAAISGVGSGNGNGNGSASGGSQPGSKNNSRPSTPGSRNLSPQTKSPLGQHA